MIDNFLLYTEDEIHYLGQGGKRAEKPFKAYLLQTIAGMENNGRQKDVEKYFWIKGYLKRERER